MSTTEVDALRVVEQSKETTMPKYDIYADLDVWMVVHTANFTIEAETAKHAIEIVEAYVNEPEAVYPPQTLPKQ